MATATMKMTSSIVATTDTPAMRPIAFTWIVSGELAVVVDMTLVSPTSMPK